MASINNYTRAVTSGLNPAAYAYNAIRTHDITPGFRVGVGGGGGGSSKPVGYFWRGTDGNVYVQGDKGINAAGRWDANTVNYWSSRGFVQTPNSPSSAPSSNTGGGGGGGSSASAKVLDTAQLASLDSLLGRLGRERDKRLQKATRTRDAALNEKKAERKREETKYQGKKLTTLQDFSGAKTDTDLNTRNTLENLVSSLSTLGLGGSRALTRQILDAANMSNRKANATQAKNNQALDTSWNEYDAGNKDDITKIRDQYGYDSGEARHDYLQARQNALYKKADIYGAVDDTVHRSGIMRDADSLNKLIAGSTFVNPKYTGVDKTMATPDLGSYTQDIAKYDTTNIAGANPGGLTPVASDGMNAPGNLAVRAIAVNDKDLGVKKKTEGDLGYGA